MEDALARELMLRCGRGDLDAFTELVNAHQQPVLRVIHRYLGRGAADAEDLAQEVFVRAFKARERYRPEAQFKTWLFRIVTNRCLNYIRDNRNRRTISLTGVDPGGSGGGIELPDKRNVPVDESLAHSELSECVRSAVERLPESQRLATIYARYEEMSHAQIAEAMGLTEKGVKSLLFRARENLRRMLAPQLARHGRVATSGELDD